MLWSGSWQTQQEPSRKAFNKEMGANILICDSQNSYLNPPLNHCNLVAFWSPSTNENNAITDTFVVMQLLQNCGKIHCRANNFSRSAKKSLIENKVVTYCVRDCFLRKVDCLSSKIANGENLTQTIDITSTDKGAVFWDVCVWHFNDKGYPFVQGHVELHWKTA